MVTTRGHATPAHDRGTAAAAIATPTHAPGVAGGATAGQAHATGTAAGAIAAQAPVTLATLPMHLRPTEATRDAATTTLTQAIGLSARARRTFELGSMMRFVASGQSLWGMVSEVQEFVGLVKELVADGTLTLAQVYNYIISRSQLIRFEKLAKYPYLQKLGRDARLTTAFLDAWSMKWPVEAGEEYVQQEVLDLLRKDGKPMTSMLKSLDKNTARVRWEDEKPEDGILPEGITLWNVSDELFPYDKEGIRRQLLEVVNATLSAFHGLDHIVSSWVDANGRADRLYGIFHAEKLIGYMYQNMTRCGNRDRHLIQGYGVLEEYRGMGLGSAVNYRLLKDLQKFHYILADIDRHHPDSLACLRRAVRAFGRRMVPLGRLNRDTGDLNVNGRPRVGECTRWCLQLEDATEIFRQLLPRGRWPRTEDEEDMSSTYLPEDEGDDETDEVEEEEEEEEEVVVVEKPRRGRGRQPKRAQYKRGKKN